MARVFISHSSRDREPAARLLEWLRGHGFVEAFLDFDKHAGLAPGADWERTLYQQIAGAEAVILVLTPNWFDSKWCFAEFTQARALGKLIFPVIEQPIGEAFVSADIQHLDLVKDRAGGLERLAAELTRVAVNAQSGFPWDRTRPPYPGLLAFDEGDAAIYFGRDDEIRRLIERLNARRALGGARLVALLGASGSGKSSLLRAGVVPRLKRDRRNWIVLPPFRPQLDPVDELAQALAAGLGANGDWRRCREALAGPEPRRALSELARDLRAAYGANEAQILLPIDQGEELFGTADKSEAERFFRLLDAMLGDWSPFIVLLALRSDFLGQLQQAPGLTAAHEEYSLKPLPLERVRDIIVEPARIAGLTVDDALTAAAMRDAATDDALPLLAFALRELYDRHAGDRRLTLAEYQGFADAKEGLSPLENAVRRRADQVLATARPAPEDLAALKDAFVPAMVRVNAAGEYVRRPARLDALPGKARGLLEKLAQARLLTIRQEGEAAFVEVAHEALLRKWPLLRGWLDEELSFLIGKDQLEQDLRDWERTPPAQQGQALLTGLKLTRARAWLIEKPLALSDAERKYIQASIAQQEAEARRRERVRRYVQLGTAAGVLVLAVAAGIAFREAGRADTARDAAERNYAAAVRTAAEMVNAIDGFTGASAINPKEAQRFLEVTGNIFGRLAAGKEDPVAIRAEVQLLEVRARTQLVLGNLGAALETANEANKRARAYAERWPDSPEWQALVAKSYRRLGDVAQEAGDLDAALAARRAWNAVARREAARQPRASAAQADLAFSLEKIGDTLWRQGAIDQVLAAYRPALDILQRLREQEPANTDWQLELAFNHERLCDLHRARGDFAQAIGEAEAYWRIFDALVRQDAGNDYWQRGLGLSQERWGDALLGGGDADGALTHFTEFNAIATRLSGKDRANMNFKREWGISHAKLGEARLARRQPEVALKHYRVFLRIAEEVAEQDARNALWRRDQGFAHLLVGDGLLALGRADEAVAEYREDLAIMAELDKRMSSYAEGRRNLGLAYQRLGAALAAQGRRDEASEALKACLAIDVTDAVANPISNRPAKLHDDCRQQLAAIGGQTAKD